MKRLLFLLLFCVGLYAQEKNLLLFLDRDQEELVGTDFNVSYQFVVALMQQPGTIVVSQSLLRTVMQRREQFMRNMRQSDCFESEFISLFFSIPKLVDRSSVDFVNKKMNQQWLEKKYPHVASASQEEYRQKAFNFLCFYALQKALDDWQFIQQKNGFIVCSLDEQSGNSLTIHELDRLRSSKQGSVIHALKSVVKSKKDPWVLYLSAHGYPCDEEQKTALVSGMTVSEFRSFLEFLDTKMNTTLLAYNSCFAGGTDGLSVYKKDGRDLSFSYPIIMTSITDAPTYVFGTPSGFKLPPYNFSHRLDSSDIQGHELQPFFLQHFSEFFEYAHKKFCGPECMFLINRYKECLDQGCPVYKIENMPLVRHPGSYNFIPLDDRYHFVMDTDEDEVIIADQRAVLWYQKRYRGTIYCMGTTPVFVSMLHEKNNKHTIDYLVISTDIRSFLQQAFVVLDEQNMKVVWHIRELVVQTRRGEKVYHDVRIKQDKNRVSWSY